MKFFSRLTLAFAVLAILPSCSLMSRWGRLSPRLEVVDETREVAADGRVFVTRRYQITANPHETFSETLETRQPWAATY